MSRYGSTQYKPFETLVDELRKDFEGFDGTVEEFLTKRFGTCTIQDGETYVKAQKALYVELANSSNDDQRIREIEEIQSIEGIIEWERNAAYDLWSITSPVQFENPRTDEDWITWIEPAIGIFVMTEVFGLTDDDFDGFST